MSGDLLAQINSIKWFHRYDKETFGFETNGVKGCRNIDLIKRWGITPELFKDKTVLDIGAWDGYYSFYAEKCGAKRVLAVDHPCWSGDSWGTKDGFNLIHKILNSNVESLDIDLCDLTPEIVGTFDVVLLFGVLYHLRDPHKGLKIASSLSNNKLIVETTCETKVEERDIQKTDPLFIENPPRFKKDKTSFFSPNLLRIQELFNDCEHQLISMIHSNTNQYGGRVICFTEKQNFLKEL
jgi:tRNA (mo5U34)-methyltransferase